MDTILDIMFACRILHNMIIDDECDVLPSLENILASDFNAIVSLRRGLSFQQLAAIIQHLSKSGLSKVQSGQSPNLRKGCLVKYEGYVDLRILLSSKNGKGYIKSE